jgi:hypothetical protein
MDETTQTTSVLSLRQRAANAAAYARVMREHQAVKEAEASKSLRQTEFAAAMKRTFQVEIDPGTIQFPMGHLPIVTVHEPAGLGSLTFAFEPDRYRGADAGWTPATLRLAWFCEECGGWQYSTEITDLETLADRIKDVDKWMHGAVRCPGCVYLDGENAGPAFPVTPSQTTERKLVEALAAFVAEVMESERQEA